MYVTIVVPAYNESEVLETFYKTLNPIISNLKVGAEILFVNDGSKDNTLDIIKVLAKKDSRISYINLSRNFGKEAAMSAGLDKADGDAVIFIDADLQDPPELIPVMIEKWLEGYDGVFARRTKRDTDTYVKRKTAQWFYRFMGKLSRVEIPENTGDFRLISRRSVLALRKLPETNRFMKGLFAWVGYPQAEVTYERPERAAGDTKFNYWKLWNFALDGITAFSTLPLRMASYIGGLLALGAFIYGMVIILKTLLWGDPVAGYPSLMVVMLFLGGLQLMFMGVFGEYLGRMFEEVKRRPLYLIETHHKSNISVNRDIVSVIPKSGPINTIEIQTEPA